VHCVWPGCALNVLGGHGAAGAGGVLVEETSSTLLAHEGAVVGRVTGTEPSAQVPALASDGEPTKEVDASGHDQHAVASCELYVFAWRAAHVTAPRCDAVPWKHGRTPRRRQMSPASRRTGRRARLRIVPGLAGGAQRRRHT
jgi:hypothetical protein